MSWMKYWQQRRTTLVDQLLNGSTENPKSCTKICFTRWEILLDDFFFHSVFFSLPLSLKGKAGDVPTEWWWWGARNGCRVPSLWQRSITCTISKSWSANQSVRPAGGPPEHAEGAGWGHVPSKGVCAQYVHRRQQVLSPFECVCAFLCTRCREGQRPEAYNNHKLSDCGSSTSNEMAQIKVCLWVVCVWCVWYCCL